MDCAEVRDEFSALLDGELTGAEHDAVLAHLSQCSDCLRQLEGLKRVDDAYRSLGPTTAPEDFEERLKKALQPPKESPFAVHRLERRSWWPLAAAAVVLIACITVTYALLQTPPAVQLAQLDSGANASAAPRHIASESLGAEVKRQTDERWTRELALQDTLTKAEPPSPSAPVSTQGQAAVSDAPQTSRKAVGQSGALTVPEGGGGGVALRNVAGRALTLQGDVWTEAGYAGESVTVLSRPSEALDALMKAHPELAPLIDTKQPVRFKLNDTWYEVQPKRVAAP